MSKVTAKYQVTIPVKVRKEMGIVPGTEVDITKKEWNLGSGIWGQGIWGQTLIIIIKIDNSK